MDHSAMIDLRLSESRKAVDVLAAQKARLVTAIELLTNTLKAGGTVFTCGNGGSAAEALHLAEELTGRYKINRAALRAI